MAEETNNFDLIGLDAKDDQPTSDPKPPELSPSLRNPLSALKHSTGTKSLSRSDAGIFNNSTNSSSRRPQSYASGAPTPSSLIDLVNNLLRPTETCLMCSEVKYTRSSGRKEDRLLAVVSTIEGDFEESCLFLLKRSGPRAITIRLTIPILADFRIAITQSKPVNLEDEESVLNSKTELILKLSSGGRELCLELQTLDSLQTLVVEIKRLAGIAARENFREEGNTHRWVKFYAITDKIHSPSHTLNNLPNYTPLEAAVAPTNISAILSPSSPFTRALDPGSLTEEILNPLVLTSPGLVDEGLSIEEENARRLKSIKEQWVQKEMRAREAQFTTYDQIRLFVGTWNVNGKYATQTLSPWLQTEDDSEEPDFYILGFQELDLSAEAFLLNDSIREEEWCGAVVSGLGAKAEKYTKLISKQLVGMFLVLFVKTHHLQDISELSLDSAGVGIMGMMGNKGAVAIRLRFRDSYLTFVNSHLAADSNQVERRNQDFQDICRRIGFPASSNLGPNLGPNLGTNLDVADNKRTLPSTLYGFNPSPMYKTSAMTLPRNPRLYTIFDSDHLIWLGDLNYRLSLTASQVHEKLAEENYCYLLNYDQLKLQQLAGKAFSEFNEGDITFAPSYKYDIGTNTYDSSEKKRIPSWCDRILWKSQGGGTDQAGLMEQIHYKSHMELTSSDHKPVSAQFQARIKTVLVDKYQEVYAAMIRELDKFENQSMPDAKVSSNQLDFKTINYLQSKEQTITIENTGQVYLQFQFIPKMDEHSICKPWLWVNPPNGMIMPGEKLRVSFVMLIDRRSAPSLNMGQEQIDDILILHLINGKDYFISVSGKYCPTSLAVSLDYLARLPKPIRHMDPLVDSLLPIENQLSVPLVLWRIVDFLHQYGMEVENLFLNSGNQETMLYIRECLDTGADFDLDRLLIDPTHAPPPTTELDTQFEPPPIDPVSNPFLDGIHSMAEMLIRFLEALPVPVIPYSLYDLCLEASVIGKDAAIQALETLPRIHLNTFLYITSLIKEIVANNQVNNDPLLVERLAVVFASVMLRPERDYSDRYDATLEKKKWFIMFFLVEDEDDLMAGHLHSTHSSANSHISRFQY